MRQKHAESDLAAARVVNFRTQTGKSGQKLYQWLFKFELAAFMQKHADSGGGNHLGDRSQIINGVGGNGGRAGIVSEMPETFMRDELALVGNRNRGAGERTPLNAGAQDIKRTLKLCVLAAEGVR